MELIKHPYDIGVLVLFPFYRWENKVTEGELVAQDELVKVRFVVSPITFCLMQSC